MGSVEDAVYYAKDYFTKFLEATKELEKKVKELEEKVQSLESKVK